MQVSEVTMKDFREMINGDEAMLKFAGDHLDVPDGAIVRIIVDGQLVIFGIVEDEEENLVGFI